MTCQPKHSCSSFGTSTSTRYDEFCWDCYIAGAHWAQASKKKLPRFTTVNGCTLTVVKSRTEAAASFVKGWRDFGGGHGVMNAPHCPI
jgi:hypothetical protein